jgi:hypothetical protein
LFFSHKFLISPHGNLVPTGIKPKKQPNSKQHEKSNPPRPDRIEPRGPFGTNLARRRTAVCPYRQFGFPGLVAGLFWQGFGTAQIVSWFWASALTIRARWQLLANWYDSLFPILHFHAHFKKTPS